MPVIPSLNPAPSLSHNLGSCLHTMSGQTWQPFVVHVLALLCGTKLETLGIIQSRVLQGWPDHGRVCCDFHFLAAFTKVAADKS